jgi:hypothetical protein
LHSSFTDEVPTAEFRKGLVVMCHGEGRPTVCAPIHVVRKFCELTIRKLDAHEAEQAGRVVPLPCKRGPISHS